jgi:hypothetical protein
MDAGKPDADMHAPPPPSLAARVAAAVDARRRGTGGGPSAAGDWRVAAGVALLLAAAPLLTIAGATLLAERERDAAMALRMQGAPASTARAARAQARAALAPLLARPGAAATLDALARVLPADARLQRVLRADDGILEFDVATPDPDRLRAALRRAPALAGLRDTGQRQGDGALIVAFRVEAQ